MAVATVPEELKELVGQMPDPDKSGRLTGSIDKEKIERAVERIYQGGEQYVVGLLDMLGPPGSEQEVKPRYALHCLVNYPLIKGDESGRRRICQALAAALAEERPAYVKRFICQALQWAGHDEAVPALGRLLLDPELVEPATMALMAIGRGAAEQFLAAAAKAKGKCRLNVVQGLAAVGNDRALPVLRGALADREREVRLAAAWGLARLADKQSAAKLLAAAKEAEGWERIQLAKHCLVLAERLAGMGDKAAAKGIYQTLKKNHSGPGEKHIAAAAQRGLLELLKS